MTVYLLRVWARFQCRALGHDPRLHSIDWWRPEGVAATMRCRRCGQRTLTELGYQPPEDSLVRLFVMVRRAG